MSELLMELAEKCEGLSCEEKLLLAEHLFGGQRETDNQGQFLIYTGLMENDNGDIVEIL